jgi:hypothetical protein
MPRQPPKKKRPATSPLEDASSPSSPLSPGIPPVRNIAMEATMNAKLDLICAKMEKIDIIEQKIDSVEAALHDLRKENSVLREELAAKDIVISSLSEQLNKVDQAARSASVRIIGLPINSDTTQQEVAKIVFDAIIHPIFLAAKTAGELPNATFAPHFLINNVFSIPAKKGQACPVILTLSSQFFRGLLFKYKKTALPSEHDPVSKRDRPKFLIFEDLSPPNFNHLRALAKDDRVKSAWSFGGQLRFRLHTSETVYRVRSLADTVDSITKAARNM